MDAKKGTSDLDEFSELLEEQSPANQVAVVEMNEDIRIKEKVLQIVSQANSNVDEPTLVKLFYEGLEHNKKIRNVVSEDEFINFVVGFVNSKAKNLGKSYKVNFLVLGATRRKNKNKGNYSVNIFGFVQSPETATKWAFAKLYKNYDNFDSTRFVEKVKPRTVYAMYASFLQEYARSCTIDSLNTEKSKINNMVVGEISDIIQFSEEYVIKTQENFAEKMLPDVSRSMLKKSYKRRILSPSGSGTSSLNDDGWANDDDLKVLIIRPTEKAKLLEDKDMVIINGHSYDDPLESIVMFGYNRTEWQDFDYEIDVLIVLGKITGSKETMEFTINPVDIQVIGIQDVSQLFP